MHPFLDALLLNHVATHIRRLAHQQKTRKPGTHLAYSKCAYSKRARHSARYISIWESCGKQVPHRYPPPASGSMVATGAAPSTLDFVGPRLFERRKPIFHASLLVDAVLCVSAAIALDLLLSPGVPTKIYKKAKRLITGDENAGFVTREVHAVYVYSRFNLRDQKIHRNNQILQKAIETYLADILQLNHGDILYELLEKSPEQLASEKCKALRADLDDKDHKDREDDRDSSKERAKDASRAFEQITRLRIAALPRPHTWVEVKSGIYFQHYSRETEVGSEHSISREIAVTFLFKSNLPNGSRQIDRLVQRAFLSYQKTELASLSNDPLRYMFVQNLQKQRQDDGATTATTYKRYALGEDKSFHSLFFDEKQVLMQLLDDFTNQTGKFAIKGFPNKLGLLLHGPPGTGKTSLIKAVAQYTKRHIVTISLAKIKTNQELMDALFDLCFEVQGKDLPLQLGFRDVVFVMEDIDCASSVVLSRDQQPTASERASTPSPSSPWAIDSSPSDQLNLSGLLNVLDGAIDSPGRIVIMTTNHPDKLDPALIRPGRVNRRILLGYMSPMQIQLMLEYYFQTQLTHEQCAELETPRACQQLTPAEIEELCAECASVDQFIKQLHQLGG